MKKLVVLFVLVSLGGCSSPVFRDKGATGGTDQNFPNQVTYQLMNAYKASPPDCIAILPFTSNEDGESAEKTRQNAENVRRAFYAHLAPQGKRDVEIPRVNFVVSTLSEKEKTDNPLVGKKLNCDALVTGTVTEYGSNFFGVYSRVAVGADLAMHRAKDGALLWEASHVAESHGGSVPLSPIGLALGIVEAANNVREEQIYRIIDDLARRLVSTIPDDRMAVLDEPLTPTKFAETKPEDANTFLASLDGKIPEEQERKLLKAIEENRFGDASGPLYQRLVEVSPDNPAYRSGYARHLIGQGDYAASLEQVDIGLGLDKTDDSLYFLKGRVLIQLDNLQEADAAIVKAVALDEGNAGYLNGLGYVNSLRGRHERALAAYRMAIDRDSANGFAYYNTAVTLNLVGDKEEAADAFYGAGLAYLKKGNYGPATKALADLKEVSAAGIPRPEEIEILEQAMAALTKGGN